jgi:hypothetical protein
MKLNRTWLIVLSASFAIACASTQDQQETQPKDAAAFFGDALPAKDQIASDTAFALDGQAEVNQPAPDTGVLSTLDVAPADRPPADVVADAAREDAADHPASPDTMIEADTKAVPAEAGAMDAIAEAGAKDASAEAGTKDGSADAGADLSPATGFPCRTDSDCCITIDSCMARAYLYSQGPGAAAPPEIPVHAPGDMCLACIPPAIQVRCVSGQCGGEKVQSYTSLLLVGHCGYVNLPDGGASGFHEISDAGSPVPTRTTWSCGGH